MTQKNKIIIAVSSLLAVAVAATVTVLILSGTQPDEPKEDTPQSIIDNKAKAEEYVKSAAENEAAGKTDEAIKNYEEALKHYNEAGDEGGASGAQLQIDYLKNLPVNPVVDQTPVETMIRGQEDRY